MVGIAVYSSDDSLRKLVGIFLVFIDVIVLIIEIVHATQPRIA